MLPAEPDDEARGAAVGRRVVLGMLGLAAGGVLFAGRTTRLFTPTPPGSDGFRIYSVVSFSPRRTPADYRLNVTGLVDHPVELTYDDLLARPATRVTKDFQCVTGWRVRNVHWTGVRLAHLLEEAGVQPGGRAVILRSFDGTYSESLTLEQARRDDVLVAYRLHDRPISDDHGGPVRLYVAPMYGYKSIKWLDEIEVVDRVVPGYWERRGYDTDAWIGRSNGRDDAPVG